MLILETLFRVFHVFRVFRVFRVFHVFTNPNHPMEGPNPNLPMEGPNPDLSNDPNPQRKRFATVTLIVYKWEYLFKKVNKDALDIYIYSKKPFRDVSLSYE